MPSTRKSKEPRVPLALRRRLAFIEEVLFWSGEAARFHLQERFEISPQRAALDFAAYRKLHSRQLRYDARRKRYVPTPTFAPRYYEVDLTSALRTWAPTESVPRLERAWEVDAVRVLVQAIRSNLRCSVKYRSMSGSDRVLREISPHTFVDDGERWHVRVYDHSTEKWCDLVLGRIEAAEVLPKEALRRGSDQDWEEFITLSFRPSAHLAETAQKGLAADFAAHDRKLVVHVRRALSFYVAARLGVLRFGPARWRPDRRSAAFIESLKSEGE